MKPAILPDGDSTVFDTYHGNRALGRPAAGGLHRRIGVGTVNRHAITVRLSVRYWDYPAVAQFESSPCDESPFHEFFVRKCHPPTNPKHFPLQSYLELLRLPNVFTAIADVAMGFFFVQAPWAFSDDGQHIALADRPLDGGPAGRGIRLALLGGMVLNDVFDIDLDREEQPYRPLPSGRISLSSARWLGWQLLTLGVMLASGTAVMLAKSAGRTPTTSSSPGCRPSWRRRWRYSSSCTTPG